MAGDFCTYDAMMAHAKKGRHPARWRPRRAVDARDDHWKVLGGLGEEGQWSKTAVAVGAQRMRMERLAWFCVLTNELLSRTGDWRGEK